MRENFFTKNGLISSIAAVLMMIAPFLSRGQVLTGVKTIPGSYTDIASAISDLNANGVGTGGVIFNIAAGYTETISATLAVTATGTAANPITFRKDPLGSGANPLVTAYVGTLLASSTTSVDGIWSFAGSDYVTIDGIDLLDPASNTTATTTMEFGYGFFKASATNGANNNTVKNCSITLNRINFTASTGPRWAGSIAIEVSACTPAAVGTIITQTSVAGASSNNKFYSNTIQNCNGGIALSGPAIASPYTLADLNNDIGGTSASTGNTIINFGGGTSATNACMAAWANNQWGFNISYNTVNNNTGTGVNHPTTNRGIFAAASSIGASANINNNTVTIQGGASTSAIDWGIDCEMAQSGANGNTININNNTVTMTKTAASTAAFTAIWINSAATTVNVNNNVFPSFTYSGTGVSECILSQLAGIGTLNIMNNSLNGVVLNGGAGTHYNIAVTATVNTALNIVGDTLNGVTFNGATSKIFRAIYVSTAIGSCTVSINNNTLSNFTWVGGSPTGEFSLVYAVGTALKYNINNNTLLGSITSPTTGALYVLYNSQATPYVDVLNNTLTGTGITKTGAGTAAVYGYYNFGTGAGLETISGNNFSNITVTGGSGVFYGIFFATVTTNVQICKNNTVNNLTYGGTGTYAAIYWGYGEVGSELYGNTVNNITGAGAVNGILTAGSASNSLNIYNNQISNVSTTGAALAVGISHTLGTLTSMYNNKIYNIKGNNAGASASGISISGGTTITAHNNLIDSITTPITNAANPVTGINITGGTNVNLYYNTILLAGTSTAALFGSSGIYAATSTNLRMNNNIVVNNTIPVGAAGFAVAYRRSSTTIFSYSNASNNNIFYAGPAGTPNYYIYHDGTAKDSLMGVYQARVAPREAASATENVVFINTSGSLANFLQPDSTVLTKVESGAANITGITKDNVGNLRQGNTGYVGTGSSPDIGGIERNLSGIVMMYDSSNTDQVASAALKGFTNQAVLRMRVYTENSFSPTMATRFKLNTAGTTTLADISNAKVFYTGSSSAFGTTNQFGTVVAAPNGTFYITGSQALGAGANYFWLTYDVAVTANSANVVDGRFDSVMIGGVNQAPIDGNPVGGTPISLPMAGAYTIGVAPYFTLAAAIYDLNTKGISSNVTINVPAAYTELAPAGGYLLGSTLLNSNLSAAKKLTITKSGAGANPLLYAYTGTSTTIDGMFMLLGCDYVTINGIDLIDTNTVSTTTQMEQGYGLIKLNNVAPFDGCQRDTIMNSTVTLNRTNVNSRGIYVNNVVYFDPSATGLTITAASDANSYNVLLGNTVQNTSSAIVFAGFVATASPSLYDQNNVVNGNTIVNFNGGGGTGYGVWMMNQANNSIINNTIDNYNNGIGGAVAAPSSLYGIFNSFNNTSSANNSNITASNNYVKLTQAGGTSGTIYDIYIYYSSGNVTVNNNTMKMATLGANVATGSNYGLYLYPNYTIAGTTQLIKNNHMDSITINNSTGTFYAYYIYGGGYVNECSGNTFTNFSRTGGTSGGMYALYNYYNASYSTPGVVNNIFNNTLDSINNGASNTGTIYFTYLSGGYTVNIYNNLFSRLYAPAAATIYNYIYYYAIEMNMYNNTVSNFVGGSTTYSLYLYGLYWQNSNFYNNKIDNISSGASGGTVYGIYEYYGGLVSMNINKNTVTNLSVPTGSGTVVGMYIGGAYSGAPTNFPINTYNNVIGNLTVPNGTGSPAVSGIRYEYPNGYNYVGTAANNTINIAGTLGSNGSSAAVYIANVTPTVRLQNNILINNTTVSGTGVASVIQRVSATYGTYSFTSNNNVMYAGTPGLYHVMNFDGTNKDQTLAAYKARVAPAEASSVTENTIFINATVPANANYMQPDSTIASAIESGALTLGYVTDDYTGKTRQGNAGYVGTGSAPDIGAFEGNYLANDVISPVITFTAVGNVASTGDRTVTATLTDYTGVPSTLFPPVLYYKKNYLGSYTPAAGTRVSGNAKAGTWSFTISATALGAPSLGDSVYYYIVAQDTSTNNNLGSLPAGAIGSDVNTISTPPPTQYTYKFVTPLFGNFTVGASGTYPSLTNPGGAFEAINGSALSGNVTLTVVSDLAESGLVTLKKWSENGTGGYSVKIVPDGTVERQIVDTLISAVANTAVITFDGATRATIDGRFNGSGKYLRLRNRGANGIAVLFRNDAVRDTVQYCNLECVTTVTATVVFAGSNIVGGRGNDSNAVMYNNIGDTLGAVAPAGASNTGIYSAGTVGMENDANTISYNNIYNFGYNAVNLTGAGTGNYWTFYGNNLYQTANRSTGSSYYMFYITQGYGHIFRKNSIGGAAPDRSGIPITNTSSYWYVFYQTGSGSNFIPNVYDSNTIANFSTLYTYPYYISAGAATVSNNYIGGKQTATDSITCGGQFYGIYTAGTGNMVINNNNIGNISYTGGGTGYFCGIYSNSYGAINTMTNNYIHDMTGNGAGALPTTMYNSAICLYNTSTGGPITIDRNTISNIYNVGGGFSAGIGVYYAYSATSITRNKISGISSNVSLSEGIYGPYYNYNSITIANNQISLTANGVTGLVNGLHDAAQYSGTTNSYYNNSVFINGVASPTATTNSYGFFRNGTGLDAVDVRNNILYNKRSGGLGNHYAVGYTNVNGIQPSTINYNLMVVGDTAKLVEMPFTTVTGVGAFNASYTSSPNANWMALTSAVPAQTLYTDTATGNLSIVTTNANSWYANGKGIAVAAVANDFAGNVRSTTIAGGATDIGAYEFTTATAPVAATASAAPALNTTTSYTFAGRQVASITWGAAGTVPTSVAVQYYTGTNAPSLLASKTQFNSHYVVTPTGGTGYTYTFAMSYDSSMFGNVSSSSATRMARYKSPTWNLLATSSANGISGMLSAGVSAAATTLPANFTGTDVSNPLPVELMNMNANRIGNDVLVKWTTASENNTSVFEVERSFDENTFEFVGSVAAAGFSNQAVSYKLIDNDVVASAKSNMIYYRLRMVDKDGSETYSKVVAVNLEKEMTSDELSVYPNPFNSDLTVSVVALKAGKATCTISDITGKTLVTYTQDAKEGVNQINVDGSTLNAGMFFLSIELNGEKQTVKVVKQ